jgi:hypothetical protein
MVFSSFSLLMHRVRRCGSIMMFWPEWFLTKNGAVAEAAVKRQKPVITHRAYASRGRKGTATAATRNAAESQRCE